MDAAEPRPLKQRRPRVSRLVVAAGAAFPLLTVFIWLLVLYGWESWGNSTPWLISDEFEHAQLSRAVADTGHEAWRGVPHAFDSLYVYLVAPAWWIHDTAQAYDIAKVIGVVLMTSVVFPTYLLARTLVSPRWALYAAAGAAMIPALAYSSMLIEEPLAYPWAALCFFLLARALATRSPRWIAAATVACVVAPRVRAQLVVVTVAAAGAVLVYWFTSERSRASRRNWTGWDWVGFVVLSVCAATVLSAIASHHSAVWQISTEYHPLRMLRYGLWAAGALTIGVGVLPTIAGLSALVSTRGERASREQRAFVSVAVAMFVAFGVYTAAKSAYVWTLGLTYLTERNLIYVAPLLFVGTALVLERRRAAAAAVIVATTFVLYVVIATPYELHATFFFDAPGLSVLEAMSRDVGLTSGGATALLVILALLAGAMLLFIRVFRRYPVSLVVPAAAGLVLAWNAYGEIAFARASHAYGRNGVAGLPRPLDWVDRAVPDGSQVYYLGQSLNNLSSIFQLEFWNRSIQHVWSTDGTAPGPAPTVTPDVISTDGRLKPGGSEVEYMVADHGITPVGRLIAEQNRFPLNWKLYRVSSPFRLRQSLEGVYGDDWGRQHTALNRFSSATDKPSVIKVRVSRVNGGSPLPATVVVKVGKLALGKVAVEGRAVSTPIMGEVLETRRLHVQRDLDHVFEFKAPQPPFRVETFVTPLPAAPAELNSANESLRPLAAQVYYSVEPR